MDIRSYFERMENLIEKVINRINNPIIPITNIEGHLGIFYDNSRTVKDVKMCRAIVGFIIKDSTSD